jgi:hypothetical protein
MAVIVARQFPQRRDQPAASGDRAWATTVPSAAARPRDRVAGDPRTCQGSLMSAVLPVLPRPRDGHAERRISPVGLRRLAFNMCDTVTKPQTSGTRLTARVVTCGFLVMFVWRNVFNLW